MITALTKSAEDTRELAAALSAHAGPGDLILLAGDLATGKTTFAQGFGRGLGVQEAVVSPTFTLVRHYLGRIPLVHCDVYRLDHLQEVIDLALPELLDDGAVALVEWGDVAAPSLPPDFLEIRMDFAEADDSRSLRVRAVGSSWPPRMADVRTTLARWQP